MKIKISFKELVEREFPKGTQLLTHEDGWVTWFKVNKRTVEIGTCPEEDFECGNDDKVIELWKSEIKKLIKLLKL